MPTNPNPNPQPAPIIITTIRLPKPIHERLSKVARSQELTRTQYLINLICRELRVEIPARRKYRAKSNSLPTSVPTSPDCEFHEST